MLVKIGVKERGAKNMHRGKRDYTIIWRVLSKERHLS